MACAGAGPVPLWRDRVSDPPLCLCLCLCPCSMLAAVIVVAPWLRGAPVGVWMHKMLLTRTEVPRLSCVRGVQAFRALCLLVVYLPGGWARVWSVASG